MRGVNAGGGFVETWGPRAERGVTGNFPRLCIAVAVAVCVFFLAVRYLGDGPVAGFGVHHYRSQPLMAVGGLFLALTILAGMRGEGRRITLPLLLISIAVCLTALLQAILPALWPGFAFNDQFDSPTRLELVSTATLLLLAIATGLAVQGGRRASQQAVLLASLALGIAIVAGAVIPLGIIGADRPNCHALLSVPGAILRAALSIALISWRYRTGWPRLAANREIDARRLRLVLTACIVVLASFALLRLWVVRNFAITSELAEAVDVGTQIMVSAAIVLGAWSRIGSENAARRQVTRALDSAPIALVDMKGDILHWSNGCERLYQWTAAEAVGRNKHGLLGAEARSGRWRSLVVRLEQDGWCEEEIVEHRRDGTPLFTLEQARLLSGEGDREPVIVLSMTDITARVRFEKELRSVLDTVPDAMVTVDERGIIRSFSAAAERLLGYRASEVVGRDVKLLIPVAYQEEHDRRFNAYLETGTPYLAGRTQTLASVHRDGNEIPVELALGEGHIGQERLFVAFLRSQTERLAAQARLTELREELFHVSRLSAMGEMAAGLAHELNQPLAASANFIGAADLLLTSGGKEADIDRIRELVRLAGTQALRAGGIVKRMRSFSSRGSAEMRVEPLAEILYDAVDMVLAHGEWQRTNVRFELARDCALIWVDRVQIQQVIVNLVRNALEAMADRPDIRPEIVIQSRGTEEGAVEIAVQDNGPGIAAEMLHRWREPFFSTKANGMGVGLSICRRIIEAHGGTLFVENRVGAGASIRFTVPAADETELVGT